MHSSQVGTQQQSGYLVRGAVCRNQDVRHWVLPNVLCKRSNAQQVGKLSPNSAQVSRCFVSEGPTTCGIAQPDSVCV